MATLPTLQEPHTPSPPLFKEHNTGHPSPSIRAAHYARLETSDSEAISEVQINSPVAMEGIVWRISAMGSNFWLRNGRITTRLTKEEITWMIPADFVMNGCSSSTPGKPASAPRGAAGIAQTPWCVHDMDPSLGHPNVQRPLESNGFKTKWQPSPIDTCPLGSKRMLCGL
mmetsp:Transcript_20527/g.35346  ORF Transcript_20527/g.35346 Transcript_20527/m.35346 type:complete len:170 (-) Transcript_20527:535-1044(-)